jgi:hypothetical protein
MSAMTLIPGRAAAQECPKGTVYDHDEKNSSGNVVTITPICRCAPGYVRQDDTCVEEIAIQKRQEARAALLTQLVAAIDRAAATPHCTGSLSCNYFAARVRELLKIPFFNHVHYQGKLDKAAGGGDRDRVANYIYDFIDNAVASPASGWKMVDAASAQSGSNDGLFVIAVAQSLDRSDPEEHGHVAIVVPDDIRRAAGASAHFGPWLRDGQHAEASVRTSQTFDLASPPVFAVWTGPRN